MRIASAIFALLLAVPALARDAQDNKSGFARHEMVAAANPLAAAAGLEMLKAGGSAKCLTLRLDGEEAAAWKHVQ